LKVTIIDYGMGNLFSVGRALETAGAETLFSHKAEDILSAEKLVLPGVGAFADGMQELKKLNLVEPIREYCKLDRPFLGICLGMQMMLDSSQEYGHHEGLGLISGKVIRILPPSETLLRVPHVGWSPLQRPDPGRTWKNTVLSGTQQGDSVYFVHSYTAITSDPTETLAITHYDNLPLTAVISKGNSVGCQFHPERSGPIGLEIIRNFVA